MEMLDNVIRRKLEVAEKKAEEFQFIQQDKRVHEIINQLNTVEYKLMKIRIMDIFSKDTISGSSLYFSTSDGGSTHPSPT